MRECDNCGEPIDGGYLCDWCIAKSRGEVLAPAEEDARRDTPIWRDQPEADSAEGPSTETSGGDVGG